MPWPSARKAHSTPDPVPHVTLPMLKRLFLLLPLIAFLAPSSLAQNRSADGEEVPPIQLVGDYFVINIANTKDNQVSLEQFIGLCQEATGLNFTYSTDTQRGLADRKMRLLGTMRVPRDEFYSWFQIMLIIEQFACIEIGPPHLAVIQIQDLGAANPRAQTPKTYAKWVQPEDIDEYADQPATLITMVVTLKHTDARQVATNLRQLLGDNATESIMNAGQSASLILTGFGSKIASVVHLLEVIDEADGLDLSVQPIFDIVPMEFASASDIADLLDQLLEAQRAAIQATAGGGASGQPGAARNQPETKVLVQDRTNSLLIMAMPEEMPTIKEMIARLDVDVIDPERNYHIYALQNVAAEDISTVLDDFLSESNRLAESGTGTGGRAATGASSSNPNEVIVVPDSVTNSLLIAANKTRYAEVLDLIQLLDRRQDQVLIETALIELTGSDLFNLGVELGLANLPGIGEVGGFGVSTFGLSQIDDLNPVDGVPDTKVPNLGSGFTAGILDGDDFAMPFLIKAAESNENANVLNIPSVLVSNNSSATVSTTDEQPYTTTSSLGTGASTQSDFGGYEPAGITLKISPSISAARYLRLSIELEISNFGNSTIPNSPPPRTTRKLTTQVNVPDGDTMVIGGIISDTKRETESKVPLLGDIPVVGWLFRNTSKTGSRTSLYFFVTPHILHDVDFADLAELSYRAKQDAAQRIGLERVRMIDGNFSVDEELFSLEAFQLPRFQTPASGEVDPAEVGMDAERQKKLLEAAKAQSNPVE